MKKFLNIDILKYLECIMTVHTEHYQSDFELDKKRLAAAAQSTGKDTEVFIWLCRKCGTWCLSEKNIFIKGSDDNIICKSYAEQKCDNVLAYAVELNGIEENKVTGNIYQLDYEKYCNNVESNELLGKRIVRYENGIREIKISSKNIGTDDSVFGKYKNFEDVADDTDKLKVITEQEKQKRNKLKAGSIEEHIRGLHKIK